jgi:multisubunit Na+/H+ antiporter MnhB subunit
MAQGFRRRRMRRGGRPGRGGWPRRPRRRLRGCLLLIVGLIIVLIALSLFFGGFQKGTKTSGLGAPAPTSASVAE